MSSSQDQRLIGEYRLTSLVSESAMTHTWLADQESVGRRVLVDELKTEALDQRAEFLANVRAKASTEHPLLASVYEAVNTDEECYYAHELLPGATLRERVNAKEPFQPKQLNHLLRRIAEVHEQLQEMGTAVEPIDLEGIHVDAHGVLRLKNPALAGARDEGSSARDLSYLGRELLPLVADGRSGATRLITLLSWMRGEGVDEPLSWRQVIELCQQIEQQLEHPEDAADAPNTQQRSQLLIIAAAAAMALVAVLITALIMRPDTKAKLPPRADLPDAVPIPAGDYIGVGGASKSIPAFLISAHEVTIGDYAKFMDRLQALSKIDRHQIFDQKEQPETKTSHAPEDWDNLLNAAKTGRFWNGRLVTLDSPVVGVDWWDCMAYAEWKHARLPTQDEWRAALGARGDVARKIVKADWGPVDPDTKDQSLSGVLNLAGSVSEWVGNSVVNPTNPLGGRKWVIIGGSYLNKDSDALSVEWVDDRSLRRNDVGFRLVYDVE